MSPIDPAEKSRRNSTRAKAARRGLILTAKHARILDVTTWTLTRKAPGSPVVLRTTDLAAVETYVAEWTP